MKNEMYGKKRVWIPWKWAGWDEHIEMGWQWDGLYNTCVDDIGWHSISFTTLNCTSHKSGNKYTLIWFEFNKN